MGRSTLLVALLGFCLSLAAPALTQQTATDNEHRYGLRVARRLNEKTIRLTFGPSFVPKIGERPDAYRVVSETDPAYRMGVRPIAATQTANADDAPPAGWSGKRYERHGVTLTVPSPLLPNHRYAIQALGANGQPLTGGRAAAWIVPVTAAQEQRLATDNRLGVRQMELIAPDTVQITVGDSFDSNRFDNHPETLLLRSDDDPAFRTGRPAIRVGRRSRGDCFYTDGWPYGFYQKHELFAVFDAPLRPGHTYTVNLNAVTPLTGSTATDSLTVTDHATFNPAIKVNQVGYLPDAVHKYAYLGAWMGSLGALDFSGSATRFAVQDARTHKTVLTGPVTLRHPAGARTEGYYKEDLTGEAVFEMDFSALKQTGQYYIVIPGLGRSLAFRIGPTIYVQPFRTMMSGILHQRCGIAMKMPYSPHYRPACHRNRTEITDLPRGSEDNAFRELPNHVTDPLKHDLYGGHHDAGDYNPRAHLDIAELAFLAYEVNPTAFYDGQLSIPENHNGIPDIVDEGRWALDLWLRLQDADGGVHNGTESNGDPDMTTLAEEDTKRDFAFAKDAAASLRFAACAAQASLIYERLGKQGFKQAMTDSALLQTCALRAWTWAMAHGGSEKKDALALAAIQLYRLTGKPEYRAAFERCSVLRTDPNAELDAWQQYDQRDASFYYALTQRPVDPTLRETIRSAFRRRMDSWCQWADTQAYRSLRNPQAPTTWGTGAHPIWLIDAIEAAVLLPVRRYRAALESTCDWALGCNPMGTVFTTGLGQRSIHAPLHIYSRYSPDGPIAGIQCEGPDPRTGGEKATGSIRSWIGAMLYPVGPWPSLQTYSDLGMNPEMNEGIVSNQMKSAVAYSFLLPRIAQKAHE